jgi:hypothetical protein
MNCFAQATSMGRRSQSLHRWGHKRTREREQKQESGGQALHVMSCREPQRLRSA